MARAGDNPRAWGKLLEASNAEDWKTANKIAIKYEFDKDVREKGSSMHTYYCESPSGEVFQFDNIKDMSKFFGLTTKAIAARFSAGNLTWKLGKLKGYEIWRKLKSEDE